MSNIDNALKAASETKALRIGNNILHEVGDLFTQQFNNKRAIVVADTNTYLIAGKKVQQYLQQAGIDQDIPYIFDDPNLYAEYSYIEQLQNALNQTDAIAVAVGSGAINDIVKLASHLIGRQYMCVATAASMDGYTAFGASITAQGAKQTFSCPAPQACLADIAIISKAPNSMTASGYADLFAKITAGADWILSDALQVEAIDQQAWEIVQGALHQALKNPTGVKAGNTDAIAELTEGLMLGGFAMQWHKSSRPASGAEHQFSHLWNMEHHTNEGESISHGFQVAIGTLAVSALYELLLDSPIHDLDIEECCKTWRSEDALQVEAAELFKNTDFPNIGETETCAKYISKEELAIQLQLLKDNWDELKSKLRQQLIPYTEAKERLQLVGAPTEPEHIGVSREYLRQSFIRAQYIRRRFTILDISVRTNLLHTWLDKLFGKGGIWEINEG